VLDQGTDTIRVEVRGLKRVVDRLDDLGVQAVVDLSGLEAGEHELKVAIDNLPQGVEIPWELERVTVHLAQVVEASLPVEVSLQGAPAPDYQFGEPRVEPAQVVVRGPAGEVNAVSRVVAQVDASGWSESRQVSAPVFAVPADGKAIVLQPGEVTITVPVQPVEAATAVVQPNIGPPDTGYQRSAVVTQPATVQVVGPGAAGVGEVSTERIDLTGVRGTRRFEVDLLLPPGLTANLNSVVVRVTVVEEASAPPPTDSGAAASGEGGSAEGGADGSGQDEERGSGPGLEGGASEQD
jgi:YbbR domain-containing protein